MMSSTPDPTAASHFASADASDGHRSLSNPSIRALVYLFFPGSGIGRYTHELMRHFDQSDLVDAELVCLPSYHWREEAEYRVWPHLREIGHSTPWRRRLRFLIAQQANPARLVQRIRQVNPDVVHLSNFNHLTFPLWSESLAATGTKVVATVHDIRRKSAILHGSFETRQLKRFYQWADALLVHSEFQRDELAQWANVPLQRIHVVPHGPYDYGQPTASPAELRKRYGVPDDKQVALFFGNIRDEKNLALLMQAIAPLRERLHLVIAGRGGAKGQLGVNDYRRLARELRLDDSVTFLDRYVDDTEVPDLFRLSDWSAIPYSRRFTSQSGVLNVAMHYCCPVLISDAPTFAESLSNWDLGVQVDGDSMDALRQGAEQLMARVERGDTFRFDGYLASNSWGENVKRTAKIYRDIVNSAGTRGDAL